MLHHALGLALVRLKRTDAALGELERATVLEPGNARFAYVYAVALHSTGKSDAAIARLKKIWWLIPTIAKFLKPWQAFTKLRGEKAAAEKYAERLRTPDANITGK